MTNPEASQPSSTVDAMQMLVSASKYAKADAAKNEALQYIAAWPVGQRVQLELSSADGVITARTLSAPIAPFPRPWSREERGDETRRGRPARSRRRAPQEEEFGSTEDLATELRLDQRRGYDDEGNERVELLGADQDSGLLQACGQCFPCRDDRPEDCERPGSPSEPGRREDLLAQWRHQASSGTDVSTPRVEIEPHSIDSNGWFEVTGYGHDEHGFVVKLRPDWRRGKLSNAGQHPDLKAGSPIDVQVGQLLRHHGGALRAFDRVDGKGRFILAEARSRYANEQVRRREIAVSLDRGQIGLLEGLKAESVVKATVVPARAEGTLTITLLELLHQHWSKAQDGCGASNEVLQQRGRNQRRERVHAAVVDAPANANGYVTARLLHQDSDLGVVHRFDFSIKVRGDERPSAEPTGDTDAPAVEPQVAEPQLASGDPILVKLQSDRASLDVSGLSVEDLRSIEAQQAGQITINGLPAKGEMPRRSSKREGSEAVGDEGDIAPPGVEVQAKTEKPLSRSAAAALVDLSDEPDWPNEVWSFWARTHHLRVSDRTPFIPGKHREPFEVPATVHIEETTPAEQREAQLAAFSAAHPVHSVVECVVRSLTDTGVVVDLDNGIEGFIPLTELSWGNRVKHPNQIVAPGDSLRGVVLDISVPPARPRLSTKALTADPFEAFKDRCRPGARVSGKVDGAIDQVVFIDLGNDVDGSIHISELDHVRLESASDFAPVGTAIDVEVMGFDDASRRVNLSRKRLLPHPYDEYKRNHGVGEMVVAQVDRVSPTHVNVKVGALHGVVHVSNLRWERVADATTLYASGSTLKARLLKFNDAKRQLELSVKALLPEPYENFKRQHSVGDATDFTVARVSRTHVNVLHAGGAPGVLHVSQIDHSRVEDASSRYGAGDSIRAKIIRFNDERRQVELLDQGPAAPALSRIQGKDADRRYHLRRGDGIQRLLRVRASRRWCRRKHSRFTDFNCPCGEALRGAHKGAMRHSGRGRIR